MSERATFDDTFENVLQVTSDQEAIMAYYYTDENNKVRVTEIFDVTDADAHGVLSPNEIEVNAKLQFDEWDEPTWLSQQTRCDGKSLNKTEELNRKLSKILADKYKAVTRMGED